MSKPKNTPTTPLSFRVDEDQGPSLECLDAGQKRLAKLVYATLIEAMTAESEGHFFEKSQEVMRQVASGIKQSQFCREAKKSGQPIPYGDQAIEFSLDILEEQLTDTGRLIHFDN